MTPSRRGAVSLLRASLKREQPSSGSHRAPFASTPGAAAGPGGPKPTPPGTTAKGGASSNSTQKPGGASSGNSQNQKPGGARAGGVDIYTIIPLVGLPGAALYYAYQVFLQAEHDAKINAVHDSIRQTREAMQQPFSDKKLSATPAAVKEAAAAAGAAKQQQQQAAAAPPAPAALDKQTAAPAAANSAPAAALAPAPTPAAKSAPSPAAAVSAPAPTAPPAPAAIGKAGTTAAAVAAAAATAAADSPSPAAAAPSGPAAATADAAAPTPSTIQAAAEQVLGAITQVSSEDNIAAAAAAAASQPLQREAPAAPAEAAEAPAASAGSQLAGLAASAAAAAHALRGQYTPVLHSPAEEEVAPIKKGTMGVTLDLTPSGLIEFSIERGAGPGEDWAAFTARHKQAVADAELIGRAAQQIAAWHEAEVAGLRAEADAHAKRAAEILDMAKANAEQFKRLLKQHQEMAAELRQMEVSQAEKRVSLACAEAQDKERIARSEVIDQLRSEIGALATSHEARVSQQATSHLSHSLTLAVLALEAALDSGKPLRRTLDELVGRAEAVQASAPPSAAAAGLTDPSLIKAVAESIPGAAASTGIPTLTELSNSLRSMKRTVTALSFLPEPAEGRSSGGIITHAFARLFAWFKADESGVVKALGADEAVAQGGVTGALAAAELYLAKGQLADAVHVLSHASRGSAASVGVNGWCEDAANRAKADQALKLLKAHATLLAASAM